MKAKQGLSFSKVILFFSSLFYCLIVQAADSGRSWKNIGPKGAKMQAVVFSQSHPDIVYALSKEKGYLYKSENGGSQWKEVKRKDETPFHFRSLVVDSTNPEILLTTSYTKPADKYVTLLHRSIDGGQHWHLVDLRLASGFTFMAYNSPIAQSLRTVTIDEKGEQQIAVSHDNGAHWTLSDSILGVKENGYEKIVAIDPNNSDVIYARTSDLPISSAFLYKSEDAGAHWFKIQPPELRHYAGGFTIHPANSHLLYSLFFDEQEMPPQWFRSKDGGKTWHGMGIRSKSIGYRSMYRGKLFLNPADSSFLLVSLFTQEDELKLT